MNTNKVKSLNRLVTNLDPDEKVMISVNEMFEQYIINCSKHLQFLPGEFHEYFKNERIISFRQKIPKSLNQKGDAIIQVSKVWILYIFVMQIEKKSFKEILSVFKEGLCTVKKQDELLDGLNLLLERFLEIIIAPEDEVELEKLLGLKTGKTNKEIVAFSDCKQYALVKLSIDQQKKLKSQLAVVPIKGNVWLETAEVYTVFPFSKLLVMSNYTYHPNP